MKYNVFRQAKAGRRPDVICVSWMSANGTSEELSAGVLFSVSIELGGDRFIVDEREVSKEEYENALEEFYQSVIFYERKHLPYQLGYDFNSANYKEVIDKALLQMVGIDVSVLENGNFVA